MSASTIWSIANKFMHRFIYFNLHFVRESTFQRVRYSAPEGMTANGNFQEVLNWGQNPSHQSKDSRLDIFEPAGIVPEDDHVWKEPGVQELLCHSKNDLDRLQALQFSFQLRAEGQELLSQMLSSQANVYALSDEQLGETELVQLSLDTSNAGHMK